MFDAGLDIARSNLTTVEGERWWDEVWHRHLPPYDYDQAINPSRSPQWRDKRARELARTGNVDSRDDGMLTRLLARNYWLDSTGKLPKRPGGLIDLARSYAGNEAVGVRIAARILAGQTDEIIAAKELLNPLAVGLFSAYFFDVRDRLDHIDYIGARVLRFHRRNVAELQSDSLLFLVVGYEDGPVQLEHLLAAQQNQHDQSLDGIIKRLELELARTALAIRVAPYCPRVTSVRSLLRTHKQLSMTLKKYHALAGQLAMLTHFRVSDELDVRQPAAEAEQERLVA